VCCCQRYHRRSGFSGTPNTKSGRGMGTKRAASAFAAVPQLVCPTHVSAQTRSKHCLAAGSAVPPPMPPFGGNLGAPAASHGAEGALQAPIMPTTQLPKPPAEATAMLRPLPPLLPPSPPQGRRRGGQRSQGPEAHLAGLPSQLTPPPLPPQRWNHSQRKPPTSPEPDPWPSLPTALTALLMP